MPGVKKIWATKKTGDVSDDTITHSICRECREHFLTNDGDLRSYLDSFDLPIFLVNQEEKILIANEQSMKLLGKEPEEIEDSLGGDAMECAYARLPGGCGHTIHCKTCAMRNSVTETYRTGESLKKCRPIWIRCRVKK